jgi:hypothetical protein
MVIHYIDGDWSIFLRLFLSLAAEQTLEFLLLLFSSHSFELSVRRRWRRNC